MDRSIQVQHARHLGKITRDWGGREQVSLYLNRCQVDTPDDLVAATWRHVNQLRMKIGRVVDFGAGDGRFARGAKYGSYVGYEVDPERAAQAEMPKAAMLLNKCAFSDEISNADLCIGNPPFVRNQDLPEGWRVKVAKVLHRRTGVSLSGLANAWQYFFLLALASVKADGICALIIPYEWVSRPAARDLREYIKTMGWNVSVYRLVDATFDSVLTTSSITIVDKSKREGKWSFFEETSKGEYVELASASGAAQGVVHYLKRSEVDEAGPRAIRGLSPGTQKVLTLTEGERVRSGLRIGSDVVPCVTTLRHLPRTLKTLDPDQFRKHFREAGQKCWLIRTDKKPRDSLQAYLDAVPEADYQTATCLERDEWWKFKMPPIATLLISMSFRGEFPKVLRNEMRARAVGGVCGIYNVSPAQGAKIVSGEAFQFDIRQRIVAHSNGLRKIEINQLNALLADLLSKKPATK